ncbi:hypothetical protein ACFXTN_020498 [Malus domestica]
MEDHEVPEWAYSTPDKQIATKGFDSGNITGKRRRKAVQSYSDGLSDLQWMKAVENGADISKLSGRVKKRNHAQSDGVVLVSGNAGTEEKVTKLIPNVPLVREGDSEDTYVLTPASKRHKSEGPKIEKQESHAAGGSSLNGPILTFKIHRKKRSSYVNPSSSSDGRGQNANVRGNGWA